MAALAVLDPRGIPGDSRKNSKKRIRVFTPNDRASHRVIEKQRREALNQGFLDLARLIPKLAPVSRLSKSLIVRESVEYLRAQRKMRLAAACEVRELLADYDKVLAELNHWRTFYHRGEIQQKQARPVNTALLDLLRVDQERFGTFPAGFSEKGTGLDHYEDQGGMSDDRGHFDGDIEAPNDYPSAVFSESDSVAPPGHVEAEPLFGQSVPVSGNPVSSQILQSSMPQNLPMAQQGDISAAPLSLRSFVRMDEELQAFLDEENILNQTLPTDASLFSEINTNHLPLTNMPVLSDQEDAPAMEGLNHQYHPYNTESRPQQYFYAQETDHRSLAYATGPNYTIEDMTT